MKEDNEVQGVIGQKLMTWVIVSTVILLLLLSLGGLFYAFFTPVP